MSSLKQLSRNRVFSGFLTKYQHHSSSTQTDMKFNIYLPDAAQQQNVPLIYWLSGLTCTEDNFAQKATIAFRTASEQKVAIVMPDTSPRGHPKIEGEDKDWDFGLGAGFYVNATTDKYKEHYRMYDYIVKELPEVLTSNLPIDGQRKSIAGHSMGGHGALMIFLRNPGAYKTVSAVAPISNPIEAPWGQKAFSGYLGADNKEAWAAYDSTMLVKAYNGPKADILVDQGEKDNFYEKKQLLPEHFKAAAEGNHQYVNLNLRMQPDHDHSFYTISSVITDHIEHHAKHLKASQ